MLNSSIYISLFPSDYNNPKVATLRQKNEQKKNKTKQTDTFLHAASAWPRQTPPGLILQISTLFLSHLSSIFFLCRMTSR
ncbi:hypothetical protein ACN42_g6592 [Penicillium freii]|uniref:Uncharacterized protein n=1 Tax=Penicillium freii TaxID=48697 RepID=A0A117NN99_PENFR|nr:hypothetical protein ACN42_g6592 [Penicillium freii]